MSEIRLILDIVLCAGTLMIVHRKAEEMLHFVYVTRELKHPNRACLKKHSKRTERTRYKL